MAPWFNPETRKVVGPYRRPIRASGRNRSYALVVTLLVLIVLYFIGCSNASLRSLIEMR
jgi:hypothetical protein